MKLRVALVLCMIVTMLLPNLSYAHPGRTDSKGGHYCRTNCAKWGLKEGQYHHHNSGGSGGTSSGGSQSGTSRSSGSSQQQATSQQKQQEAAARQKAIEEEQRKKAEQERLRKAEEERLRKEAEERQLGVQEGTVKGAEDFEADDQDPEKHLKGKSAAFAEGFKEGYANGWNEKADRKKYRDKGYEQALKQEQPDFNGIPENRKSDFEEGFIEGTPVRVKQVKKEQYALGKEHGLKKEASQPGDTARQEYVDAYLKGYKAGIKKTIRKEGKQSAFNHYSVKIPKEYKGNEEYEKWYREGFISNKKAAEVRKAGYAKGKKFFSTSRVPKKYKKYGDLYKASYKEGRKAG